MLRMHSRRLSFMLIFVIVCTIFIIFTKVKESSLKNLILLANSDEDFTNETETRRILQNNSKSLSIKELILEQNTQQKITNENRFGPVTENTIFITIQVHTRIDYLRYLIDSFRNAKDIEKSLLIFSHDVYDYDINNLIQSIDFAMVLQIFYPYSIQLYPDVFPGTDPRDCPRDIGRKEADDIKCQNLEYRDSFGHYRESKFTQMKHHWWWKLNRIFDELKVTKDLENFMLLLVEEDHYVAPDFIHVFKEIQKLQPLECPKCNILCLGTYEELLDTNTYNKIDISPWTTNRHNMGIALKKTTWLKVRECAEHYCTYDEYNYDFSLQNINRKCLKQKLYTFLSRGPRIFHIGECGMHHVHANCDIKSKITRINLMLKQANKDRILWPEDLEVGDINFRYPSIELINNGGWADRRDQCLCLEMTANVRNDECHRIFPDTNKINDL